MSFWRSLAVGLALATAACGPIDEDDERALESALIAPDRIDPFARDVSLYLRSDPTQGPSLSKRAPFLCECMKLREIGDSYTFPYVAADDLGAGDWTLSVSPYYTYANPTIRFELFADGQRLARVDRHFIDTEPGRRELAMPVLRKVTRGTRVEVRITMTAAEPRLAKFVLNAGPTDGRDSFLRAPLAR